MSKKKPKKSFAFTVFIGLFTGILCVAFGIITAGKEDAKTFLDLTSFLIIVGGTFASFITSFPFSQVKTFGSVVKKAFVHDKIDIPQDIDILVNLCQISRQKGLLALEGAVHEYTDDDFLVKGVLLLVDGADRDLLRSSLQTELYFMRQRHKKGYGMLDMIAGIAPALGLTGTYVGLIPMLINLDDPTTLGPLMAVELVSSFYGAFISNIIFIPLVNRLKSISNDEIARKELLIEGLTGIQEGKNPRILREELMTYMSRKEAKSVTRRQPGSENKPEVRKVVNYGDRKAV